MGSLADHMRAALGSGSINDELAGYFARLEAGPAIEKMPVYAYGHSWIASDLQSTAGARWTDRITSRLRLGTFTNRAVQGSSLQDIANHVIGSGDGAPWVPGTKGIIFLQGGALELNGSGLSVAGTRKLRSIEENLRAAILRIQSGTVEEIRGATGWTISAGWTESLTQTQASGGNHSYTTTQGSEVHKNLAAGTYIVNLRGLPGTASGGSAGGIAEILVGGTVVHTVNTDEATWDDNTIIPGHISRLIVIPSGGAELRIQKSDVTAGFVIVDSVSPLLSTPPEIFLNREVIGTQADNNQLQSTIDNTIAGLSHITSINLTDGWSSSTMMGSDGVHPNDRGQAFIALEVEKALLDLDWYTGLHRL